MDISHSEKQVLHLTFLILINLCLSYLPFVTVWASKPWGGQANICLHVLAGIEDSAVGAGCCWVQWFKRAVSSVCTFPSVPLASAVGPCWMQTRRLPQKWHCIYLKQCATPEFRWDALDPHWLQTTLLTKHYRNVHFWCIFGIFGPVFVFFFCVAQRTACEKLRDICLYICNWQGSCPNRYSTCAVTIFAYLMKKQARLSLSCVQNQAFINIFYNLITFCIQIGFQNTINDWHHSSELVLLI